ncbi:Sulfite efflux pump SSU1 [Escovopsis weberi]|uniref:Sulfite efflux pump SSU1 n=1 Tax=Escovopsis weberi TaxID=150374 RepID=A0A0M8MWQ5_ESCWE|nr:Sulfite efflux pump SSU1 [Escovopsis weberi]
MATASSSTTTVGVIPENDGGNASTHGGGDGVTNEEHGKYLQSGKRAQDAERCAGTKEDDARDDDGGDDDACDEQRPSAWRNAVRDLSPAWFAVVMGNGIVSILLFTFPFPARWLRIASCALFAFNTLLFLLLAAAMALRFVLFPRSWAALLAHPTQSLFIGCFPMALSTLLNMAVFACAHWGPWLLRLAWSLWWLEAALSLLCCTAIPFLVFTRHRPALPAATAALLLPVVPCVIAAGTGSILAAALPDPRRHALPTLLASYALWGLGEALSACVLALYFHRLALHGLPTRDAIVSVLLPIGPLGQGGFAIQSLGRSALSILPAAAASSASAASSSSSSSSSSSASAAFPVDPARAAEVLFVLGVIVALAMWAFALAWACLALASLASTRRFPFNLGWWGLTFPLGVWASCSAQLWQNLHSDFFKIVTVILTMIVLALWCLVVGKTVQGTITGRIFVAPRPKNLLVRITPPESEKSSKAEKAV